MPQTIPAPPPGGGGGGNVAGPGATTAVNEVALWGDGTGTVIKGSTMTVDGDDVDVVGELTAAEVITGDLRMRSEDGKSEWLFVEQPDHIKVTNIKTGGNFRLVLVPEE